MDLGNINERQLAAGAFRFERGCFSIPFTTPTSRRNSIRLRADAVIALPAFRISATSAAICSGSGVQGAERFISTSIIPPQKIAASFSAIFPGASPVAPLFTAPRLGDCAPYMNPNDSPHADLTGAQPNKSALLLATIPTGILLNLGIGTLVHLLKLPLFLDAVGTVLVTILVGIPAGIATGVLSFLLGGLLVNPVMPYFSGTQAAIAIFVGLMARRGFFRAVPWVIPTGILLGVITAIVSAPVIVKLFGGITGSGSGLITAFLLAAGQSVIKSVFLTGLACEPIDKMLQCLLAFWLLRSLPRRIRARYINIGYVERNFSA